MKIAMSGATGFVGKHLTRAFEERGWKVIPLRREDFRSSDGDFLKKVEGAEVVINLAGETIAAKWTEEYKKVLYDSRIGTARKILGALAGLHKKPEVFISTSAVGVYDTKGVHTEEDKNYADDFLGKLALNWEKTALSVKAVGVRTVIFRFGVVLGRDGGALRKMLMPFKLGLGGTIGDGKQPFSWVHIEDLVSAYFTVIENKSYEGIYNLTAPRPTTNKGLTKALGKALHRPTIMRVPVFALRLQFGEGAKVMTGGQSVLPKRLLDSGFVFKFAEIDKALENLVAKAD